MLFLFASIACFAANAKAQVQTAELHVTVKDTHGAEVRNATVMAVDQSRNLSRTTRANTDGQYVLMSLPPGLYTIAIEAPGFAKSVHESVRLTIGQVAELPASLAVAGSSETVTVTSEAPLVEIQKTSSGTVIDSTQICNLPINGRNYINYSLTNSQLARDDAPSIGAAGTSGLNIGGQRARNNLVNVDGTNAVDNSVNGVRSTVSQDAVQEFQILTNGYAAEYGQAAAGVINIISKSGTNNFHGSAYGYLRDRYIQATNPFSNVYQPPYTRVEAGMSTGGAIKKDRTFYFFAFESSRRHETGFNDIGAPNGTFGLVPQDLAPFILASGTPLPPGTQVPVLVTPQQSAYMNLISSNFANIPPQELQAIVPYILSMGASASVAIAGQNPLTTLAGLGGKFFSPTTLGFVPLPASFVPMQTLIGNFPVSGITDIYSLRLDHQLTKNQQLMLRGSVSPSNINGIEVNAQGPQNFGQNSWSRTSVNDFHDWSLLAEDTWTLGANKVNEFRFQYARRSLNYTYSNGPGGSDVAINMPGYAFFGREPFSYVQRVEQRWETLDNFSITKGHHNIKFGVDNNYLPLTANFTVNFGGVYDFGSLPAPAGVPCVNLPGQGPAVCPPALNPVQAYGVGIPQYLSQGVGNPYDAFSNDALGLFVQDSWRMTRNLTVNYGLRYDIEFTPVFPPATAISEAAYQALNIVKGIPRSTKNFAPRIGLAWDIYGNGTTVVRSSYGMYYDHPLMGLAFDSAVADGTQAPQLLLFGASPTPCNVNNPLTTLTATNAFIGNLTCLPSSFTYLPGQQRFNPTPNTPSIWVNQNYLNANPPVPLSSLPFGLPTGANFKYGYSEQASLAVEHQFANNFALTLQYTFNGGRRLYRPINVNAANGGLLTLNWLNAVTDPTLSLSQIAVFQTNPLAVNVAGVNPLTGQAYVPAALVNFFRPSGLNPTLVPYTPAPVVQLANAVLKQYGLGVGAVVPFSDEVANLSNGTSDYNAFTVNLNKRFSGHWQMAASYTWSHSIDDSVDLEATVAPQNNYDPNADRATSLFDQRQRFVFSAVYQSANQGKGLKGAMLSNWTLAPIIEYGSGRPFNIVTGFDQNLDFAATTDRPNIAHAGQTDACGDVAASSKYSPTGYLIPTCFADATLVPSGNPNGPPFIPVIPNLNGNLSRNAGIQPYTFFNDLRIARTFMIHENLQLQGIMDLFNAINKYNVQGVNPLWNQAGIPTAAYEPRQFQFALRLTW